MRTLIRTLINLAILTGTLAVMYWAMTRPSWGRASPHAHDVTLIVIAVASFVLGCITLYLVPSARQLEKRQRKASPRPSFTRAAPVKRGR